MLFVCNCFNIILVTLLAKSFQQKKNRIVNRKCFSDLGDDVWRKRIAQTWSEVLVTQSCSSLCNTMDCSPPQVPLSMGFSRKKYWSGLPFPSPGDLPNPGIESASPALQADSLTPEASGKQPRHTTNIFKVSLMTVSLDMSHGCHFGVLKKLWEFAYLWPYYI